MTRYLSIDKVTEYNLLALTVIRVKKADKSEVLGRHKIQAVLDDCKAQKGDVYDKAVALLAGLVKAHGFASGNRRTAFLATKMFCKKNNARFAVRDNPEHARTMTGIREGFYTHEEIKGWIKHGKIKPFKR